MWAIPLIPRYFWPCKQGKQLRCVRVFTTSYVQRQARRCWLFESLWSAGGDLYPWGSAGLNLLPSHLRPWKKGVFWRRSPRHTTAMASGIDIENNFKHTLWYTWNNYEKIVIIHFFGLLEWLFVWSLWRFRVIRSKVLGGLIRSLLQMLLWPSAHQVPTTPRASQGDVTHESVVGHSGIFIVDNVDSGPTVYAVDTLWYSMILNDP